jgi:hypothetical protein
MAKTKLFLLIAVTMLFSGCALNNYQIEKQYTPVSQKYDDVGKYSVSTKVIYEPEMLTEPKFVAVKKNGYGQETARIYLSENVDEWIKKGFDQQLKMAGFNVENGQNNIQITLKIEQLFLEPWVGFWSASLVGISKIEAQVELPHKYSYYIRKFVTYNTSTAIIWTDGIMENNFLEVTQKSLPEIVKEIRLLLLEKNK